MKLIPALIAGAALIGTAAHAAEPARQVSVLSHQQAHLLLDKAEQIITGHKIGGVVVVVDAFGQTIAFDRLDGATLANSELAPKKAHAAAAFGAPTASFQKKIAEGNPVVVPLPGGQPVKVNGVVIGAIGVSTPDGNVDEEAATGALAALNAG
ncbi:GlcG/HbpS family heme-binding protein [Pluralibacter gergoviae]|nr:heme-binding protein [Pluralibacter gergoviae]